MHAENGEDKNDKMTCEKEVTNNLGPVIKNSLVHPISLWPTRENQRNRKLKIRTDQRDCADRISAKKV